MGNKNIKKSESMCEIIDQESKKRFSSMDDYRQFILKENTMGLCTFTKIDYLLKNNERIVINNSLNIFDCSGLKLSSIIYNLMTEVHQGNIINEVAQRIIST